MGMQLASGLLFIGIHVLISSSPLRAILVNRIGLIPYLGGFSVVSAIAIGWMIWSFIDAEKITIWQLPPVLWTAVIIAIPLGLWLALLSIGAPNPTTVGQESLINSKTPATGIVRITRHPFMVGFAVWALGHMLANGDLASQLFFGTFFIQAAIGPWLIDRKRAVNFSAQWPGFAAVTSTIPFAAILAGRNQFRPGEIGWARALITLFALALLVYFHGNLFGVALI